LAALAPNGYTWFTRRDGQSEVVIHGKELEQTSSSTRIPEKTSNVGVHQLIGGTAVRVYGLNGQQSLNFTRAQASVRADQIIAETSTAPSTSPAYPIFTPAANITLPTQLNTSNVVKEPSSALEFTAMYKEKLAK
jgi:hypothetical protein